MTNAYPATNTYTSPAFANSPRAAPATAQRSWFARKPTATAAPLAAGAAAAAATSTRTDDKPSSVRPNTQQQSAVGPLEDASCTQAQTATPVYSAYGAFPQHNGHHRRDSDPSEDQPMYAVSEPASKSAAGRNVVYARDSGTGLVGPSGAQGAFGPSQSNNMSRPSYNDNKAGFFQSS